MVNMITALCGYFSGTFVSDTGGTFKSDTPGTFVSDIGGTFEVILSFCEWKATSAFSTSLLFAALGWIHFLSLLYYFRVVVHHHRPHG